MIEDIIKVHDKYQFEIKINYKFYETHKKNKYNIDFYLFIPNSLDVNRFTYKKEEFYSDMQTYIRFKTPTYLIKEIASESEGPFLILKKGINDFISNRNEATYLNYEHQLKLFCCIIKSALRDHVDFIFKKSNSKDITSLVEGYIANIKKIRANFLQMRTILNVPKIKKKEFSIYLFADEYISLLLEISTYKLLEILKSKNGIPVDALYQNLLGIINSEIQYRKENEYPSLPSENNENEELLFRQSVLKKYMGNVLFLNISRTREGKLLEQFLFGIAAGIAMIFATAIAFFSQYFYGGLTLPLFLALVISYMFKDRIKEMARYYFSSRIQDVLFDHKLFIRSSPKQKIGYCKEGFSFIKEYKIPEKIRKIRDRDHITEIENGWVGEKIIHFREEIKMFSSSIKRIYHGFNIEGINGIMRFNISHFLKKMDNPEKGVFIIKDKNYEKIYGERVYHLNLILKYSVEEEEKYKRFRIVLNRNGIKRIEKVEESS